VIEINEFITGNNFKKRCHYYFDEFGFGAIKNPSPNEIPKYFIKTDFIDLFFSKIKPNSDFIIVTHNSDYHITKNHEKYLNDNHLIKWFAQNVDFIHPKLISIPIGIANEKWLHGNIKVLNDTMLEDNEKSNLIYCNFDIRTNIIERSFCMKSMTENNLKMSERTDFKNYLKDLSKSFFVLSPNGNGVDCHKTWESLYLKTIPIVTESININFYKDFPILILKKWEDLDLTYLNKELYYKLWAKFNQDKLLINFFLNNGI
jgi:hypothetical protein